MKSQPAITPPTRGRVVCAYGAEASFLLEGKDTAGQFTMFIEVTPPGGGPPHCHTKEDECRHTAIFLADGQGSDVPAGGAASMPKDSTHTFNTTTAPGIHFV